MVKIWILVLTTINPDYSLKTENIRDFPSMEACEKAAKEYTLFITKTKYVACRSAFKREDAINFDQ